MAPAMASSQRKRPLNRRTGGVRKITAPSRETKIWPDGVAGMPFELGERLAALRRERALSLAALAMKVGVTKGFLSLVERGRKAPSISTLLRLSQAYAIPVGGLLDAAKSREPVYSLVRGNERLKYAREGTLHGYRYEAIAFRKKNKRMEPFVVSVPLRVPRKFFQHEGDELLFVLEGKVEVHLGQERLVLTGGDCLYFDASTPHRSRSIGGNRAKTFVIVSVPG
jgi:transcriptional regulator with XRE-family HTH domain